MNHSSAKAAESYLHTKMSSAWFPKDLFKLYVGFFKILIKSYTQNANNCTKRINETFLVSDVRVSVQKD